MRKILSKLRKYYDYDDIVCKGNRYVRNLLNLSIDENYYKPIRANKSFNNSYIEYGRRQEKYFVN